MSITANFYTFSKRENSTAQPSGGTTFDIVLKDDCSVISPTIKLATTNPTAYNYAYISDFGRYYFVSDWTSNNNGLWTAHLTCDVLATYKDEIGAAEEYVLRSASDFDGDIIDSLYPTKPAIKITHSSPVTPFTSSTMRFIVGIINDVSSSKIGALTYYVLTSVQFGQLLNFMFGDASYMLWLDPSTSQLIDDKQAKAQFNPIQYITECFAIPYTPKDTVSTPLHFGWYVPTVGGSTLSAPAISPSSLIWDLENHNHLRVDHPEASTRGNYLNGSPFTQLYLKAGPFGEIVIDPNMIQNNTGITLDIKGDFMGQMIMDIYTYGGDDGGKFISRERANTKMPFPVAQVNNNPIQFYANVMSTLGSGASMIGSIATGNVLGIAGNAIQIQSGVMSASQAMAGTVQKSGSQSAIIEAFQGFYLTTKTVDVVEDDNAQRGRPLCKVKTISSLSGYILVSDPDIHISGTLEENIKVKQYMASGFFYE